MKNQKLVLAHLIVFIVLLIIAFTTNGIGGGGDSLTHYFFAKSSWYMPSYFLNLWAKPIFTLLSSPFAQFGFIGIKVFNIFCVVCCSYMACLVAKTLKKPYYWLVLPIALIAPSFYTYAFTGLTEPLAALISVTAVWFCLNNKVNWGFLLASLLPFARTEAQVFLVFFVMFGLINGHYKKLPLLLTGYMLVSLIGLTIHDSPFWVFTSPYDSTGSVYGSGNWYHYLERLVDMLAWPGIILAGLGIIYFLFKWLVKSNQEWKAEPWLIHGIFLSLLVGHSIVWALGIYGSAGLERTLITGFPFLWIIILDGVLFILSLFKATNKKLKLAVAIAVIGIQISFTLSSPMSKFYWNSVVKPSADYQFLSSEFANFVNDNYPNIETFVVDKPDISLALNSDFKDDRYRLDWNAYHHSTKIAENVLWIYDSHYVPVQYGITLEKISNEGKLKEVKRFTTESGPEYVIFEKTN